MFFSKKDKIKNNVDWNYVYTIHDKISDKHIGIFYSPTDENMIRTSLPTILMDYPLRDIEVIRIGRFETNSGFIESLNHKFIPMERYLFPHSRLSPKGEDLTVDEVDSACKKAKQKQMAHVDELKENYSKKNKSEVVNE